MLIDPATLSPKQRSRLGLHWLRYCDLTREIFAERGLNPNHAELAARNCFEYLLNIHPDLDGGSNKIIIEGSLAFTVANNWPLLDKPQTIMGTRFLLTGAGTQPIGTITAADDDRGVGTELRETVGIQPAGFISAARIHRVYRGAGYGKLSFELLHGEIQKHVNITGNSEEWYLFTKNPVMVHICCILFGWSLFLKDHPIKVYGGAKEDIYRKIFTPAF